MDRYPGVSHETLGFLAYLGIKNLVQTSHNALYEHVPNSFCLDISATGGRSDIRYLRKAFRYLAHEEPLPKARACEFTWFSHLDDISEERMSPRKLPPGIKGFHELPAAIASLMGHPNGGAHMLAWLDQPNEAGYLAELCTPIPPPDDTKWSLPIGNELSYG